MLYMNCKTFCKLCSSERKGLHPPLNIRRTEGSKSTRLSSDSGRSVVFTNIIRKYNTPPRDFFLFRDCSLISETSEINLTTMPERRDVPTGFSLCLSAVNFKEMALNRPMQLNDLLWLWSSGKDFHFPPNHFFFI